MPSSALESHSHVLTVDVEEYFQARAVRDLVGPGEWSHLPSRVGPCVGRLLELFGGSGVAATFFVRPWIVRRQPEIVRRLARAGHEVGLRDGSDEGFDARSFEARLREETARLADVIGQPVAGYRHDLDLLAPERRWTLELLGAAGYEYDSSGTGRWNWPFGSRRDGTPASEPRVIRLESGSLLEVPLVSMAILGVPLGQIGACVRHLPYGLVRNALRARESASRGAVLRIRSWEIDPYQPRILTSPVARLVHYRGLDRTLASLDRLLGEFDVTSVGGRFGVGRAGGTCPVSERRNGSGA